MNSAQSLTFEFRPTDNSPTFQRTVTLNFNRTFSIGDLPQKNYTVWIKGAKWLARTIAVDVTNQDITNVNVTLRAGDANNDNSIDVLDLDILLQTFDRCLGDAGYRDESDFNMDECVDVFDLDQLLRNFDRQGEP